MWGLQAEAGQWSMAVPECVISAGRYCEPQHGGGEGWGDLHVEAHF